MKRKSMLILAVVLGFTLSGCGDDPKVIVPTVNEVFSLESENIMEGNEAVSDNVSPIGVGELTEELENMTDASSLIQPNQKGEEEEPAEPEELSITVTAAGDAALGNYFGQGYAGSFRETWEKQTAAYFLENVADIFSADDLTIVNLEGSLTNAVEREEEQTYCISGDPVFADILTEGSVEAVSMANNHRNDYYEQGTADTVEALESRGIAYAYDRNFGWYEVKGISIGFVSVNEVGQGADVEKILEEGITQLREQGAELVLVCCHWGIERENYPEDYQQSLGRKCIDWGADLVLGHHPHVLQGIEKYKGKYIVYSLGNFCFGANRNPSDKDCMIFRQTFTFREGILQENTEVSVIPCSVSSVKKRNDYRPTPAEGEEAERIIARLNEYSAPFGIQLSADGVPLP